MLRNFPRFILFLSSYFPLALITAILVYPQNRIASAMVLGIGLVSLFFAYWFFDGHMQHIQPIRATIVAVERKDNEVLAYIASYIFPFVTLPLDSGYKIAAFGLLLLLICFLYMSSNMLHINPMLMLLGYHLFAIHFAENDEPSLLLAKRLVQKGEYLPLISVSEGIYIEKQRGKDSYGTKDDWDVG